MKLFVRRAEQAMGPVTIKVPPSRARAPPTVAERDLPAPALPHSLPGTWRPATKNNKKRWSGSDNDISNNPNLIPLNSTRLTTSRKRKMGDRDGDNEPVTAEGKTNNQLNESSMRCKRRPGRVYSSDKLQEVLQRQRTLREKQVEVEGDSQKQLRGSSDLAAEAA